MIVRLVFKTYPDPNDPEVECVTMNIDEDHKEWTIQQWNESWPSLVGVERLDQGKATPAREGQFDDQDQPVEDVPEDPYVDRQLELC